MGIPQVVIVGRPNVGKSSVFNWLAGRRLAIVDDQPGVTRDRMSQLLSHNDRFFELVDTGGMGIKDIDDLAKEVEDQITLAIETADVILFTVDSREGITPLDEDVAKRLRYVDVPVICLANKTDDPALDANAGEFYKLGRGKILPVSAHQRRGREELYDMILERLPAEGDEAAAKETGDPEMKIAIVGRRNVGKSTFINTLTSGDRVIVSEIPGTTRDSIDVRFELDGKSFVAIDTPGFRKSKAVRTDIEFYSTHRAQRTIRHADVILMFFDASARISKVDKQLVKYITDQYKPCILVVNKWDLMHGQMPTEKWVTYLRDTFPMMWHTPIGFITGETGKNMKALLNHAQMLYKQSRERVSTGELNRLVKRALEQNPPPLLFHHPPKIYYATQVGIQPPTIVLMCNNPKGFSQTYQRYLLGVFRDQLSFGEVPIKLYLQKRESNDKREM